MLTAKQIAARLFFYDNVDQYVVGELGSYAHRLMLAEEWAEDRVEFSWEEEQESYESVYGEPPPDGFDFWWLGGYLLDEDGKRERVPTSSLGMIDLPTGSFRDRRDRRRVFEAQAALECFDEWTCREDDKRAAAFRVAHENFGVANPIAEGWAA